MSQTEDSIKEWLLIRAERDRAIGAMLVLVWDGVVSEGRVRELMGMSPMELRKEAQRVINDAPSPFDDEKSP